MFGIPAIDSRYPGELLSRVWRLPKGVARFLRFCVSEYIFKEGLPDES
jgi:hypothetical protein